MVMRYILILFVIMISSIGNVYSFEDNGYLQYIEGEKAVIASQRRIAFNNALLFYLQTAQERPSGKLLYNIGNCYYQLGEYGLAILYYNRALKELPRNKTILHNLEITKRKVGSEVEPKSYVGNFFLYFHRYLSIYERELVIIGLSILAFVFASLNIYIPSSTFQKMCLWLLGIAIAFLISIFWTSYFSTPEAIVIRSTPLYAGAGPQYVTIKGKIATQGAKIEILEVENGGNWLKIKLPTGEEGYISKEYCRTI